MINKGRILIDLYIKKRSIKKKINRVKEMKRHFISS